MQKKIGNAMQAAGGLLLFLLVCASDGGAVSVSGLAAGLCGAGLMSLSGWALGRRRRAPRRRMTAVIPITAARRYARSSAR